MNTLLVTLLITFILIMVALLLLGFSWFFTGKSRFRPGMCGKTPSQKNGDCRSDKNISCGLCGKNEDDEDCNR